jgi:hypothetical protein
MRDEGRCTRRHTRAHMRGTRARRAARQPTLRALDYCKNYGFVATGGRDGCTVEFPWDVVAKSNMFAKPPARRSWLEDHPIATEADVEQIAGRTSLLQIRQARHPLYANGLLSTLEVPMSITPAPRRQSTISTVGTCNSRRAAAVRSLACWGSGALFRHLRPQPNLLSWPSAQFDYLGCGAHRLAPQLACQQT